MVELTTEGVRIAHWKRVEATRRQLDRRAVREVRKQFRAESMEVLGVFTGSGTTESGATAAIETIIAQEQAWESTYQRLYTIGGTGFAVATFQEIVGTRPPQDIQDLWAVGVQQYVETATRPKIVGIGTTTARRVQTAIANGLAEGEGIPKIARRIRQEYVGFNRARSVAIARTEMTPASNFGATQAAQSTGLDLQQEWISTKDDKTRGLESSDEFNHIDADGLVTELEQPFEVSGELLLFPGDVSFGASPGNVINCRGAVAFRKRR